MIFHNFIQKIDMDNSKLRQSTEIDKAIAEHQQAIKVLTQ
jgi:hypothetical protein